MDHICKNCNGEIAMNFCANCGQKKAKRIDGKYIKDELQYVLVHTNKGFFYSVKRLIKNPGKTALEFIDGNRVNHYKPIMLVFLLAGISAFITNTFIHPIEVYERYYQMNHIKDMGSTELSGAMMKYQSPIMLVSVPFAAIFSWLAFRKWGYNYCENVVANAYLYSATLVFSILIVHPIQFMLHGSPSLFMFLPTILTFLSMVGISVWFFIEFYPDKSAGEVILRVLLTTAMLFISIIVITVVAMFIYLMLNPDKIPHG